MFKIKHWILGVALLGSVVIVGCSAQQDKMAKHQESAQNGLNRIIIQRDYQGHEIKHFEGKYYIEMQDGALTFIDQNNKEHKLIGGIITVDEK